MGNWSYAVRRMFDRWIEERQRKSELRRMEKEAEYQRTYNATWGYIAKFKCNICGRNAKYPAKMTVGYASCEEIVSVVVDDFSRPGDLEQCSHCGKWVCTDHYSVNTGMERKAAGEHEVTCRNCAR